MSSQYKNNNFSTEKLSTSQVKSQKNIGETVRPNIDHLIKKLLVERRRVRNSRTLVFLVFVIIFIFLYLNIN